jgi:hypothetical protein
MTLKVLKSEEDIAQARAEVRGRNVSEIRSGGYLLCSNGYWPEKMGTPGINIFGMSWTSLS